MAIDRRVAFDTMSEDDLAPVLELLQGRDPGEVARQAGTSVEHLLKVRDDLLAQAERQRAGTTDRPPKKVGRNDPCPCGSGKKYKHCCLNRQPPAGQVQGPGSQAATDAREAEQQKLIGEIEAAFALLGAQRATEAVKRTSRLIARYPNEDRLHDIQATGYVHLKAFEQAIAICRRRLAVATEEKAYFIETGRYRDATIDRPALSYYYPPMTWRQKYWVALKAKDYDDRYPSKADPAIVRLVRTLQTADDEKRFPQKHAQGLDLRRAALQDSLAALQRRGPEVIPYVLPLSVKYGWSGLFVPEILAPHATPLSTRSLIEISMFGFAYASGACLHYLEKQGPGALPYIQTALARDKAFDPIKTGIVAVLGNMQTPAAYRLLLDLLDHESAHIVNWAGAALGKFDRIDALPRMVAANDRLGGEHMIEAAILHLKDLENAAQ